MSPDTAITAAAPAPGPAHAGDGEALVAHHFENLEQQRDAGTLGMWVFLGSEVLFFGGLFTAFGAMRATYPGPFAEACRHLNPRLGAINTAVLLTSSLTMALAVWSAQTARRDLMRLFLALTLLFGGCFLCIKGYEWYLEYCEHLVPGQNFAPHMEEESEAARLTDSPAVVRDRTRPMEIFFCFYFIITGLHALHMLVGLGVLSVQLALSFRRPAFGVADYTPVELSGLYWHFVDIVWIYVFPMLYLMRT